MRGQFFLTSDFSLHVAMVARDGLIEPGLFMGMEWWRVII